MDQTQPHGALWKYHSFAHENNVLQTKSHDWHNSITETLKSDNQIIKLVNRFKTVVCFFFVDGFDPNVVYVMCIVKTTNRIHVADAQIDIQHNTICQLW